jgi:hypothetical protein
VFFAERGLKVATVDRHATTRVLPASADWDGWGFLDYASVNPNIASSNCDVEDFEPDGRFDAAYSIGMVAHLRRAIRDRLFVRLNRWMKPGGRFLFTVDIVRATADVWNRAAGAIVEPPEVHGTIDDILAALTASGFVIEQFRVLRNVRGSRTDILFVDCSTPADADA